MAWWRAIEEKEAGTLVTFIIGNGFDINVGLKTRYTDFYKVYTEKKSSDSKLVRRFKEEILKSEAHNWRNWADFELQMGIHSKEFLGDTPVEDFMECFDDFVVRFNDYLTDECEKIDWELVDETIYGVFLRSILSFETYVTQASQPEIKKLIANNASVNFLQFNYTGIFEALLQLSTFSQRLENQNRSSSNRNNRIARVGKLFHVHGKLGAGGYPTMGVDNEMQIENEKMRSDLRIQKIFIKPSFLGALQARNVNQKSVRDEAVSAINGSSIICTFGTSIGHTDKYWWKSIGSWLEQGNGTIIIFDICGAADDGISPLSFLNSEMSIDDRRKEITERFLHLTELDTEWFETNRERIIVELDTAMFDFKLPIHINRSNNSN